MDPQGQVQRDAPATESQHHEVFNVAKAIAALEVATRAAGSDTITPEPRAAWRADTLIGAAFLAAGLPALNTALPAYTAGFHQLAHARGVLITRPAAFILAVAERAQDLGRTWDECLKRAIAARAQKAWMLDRARRHDFVVGDLL